MSNAKLLHRLTFLRWNLDPQAAALWHHATKQVVHQMDARTRWIEVDPSWKFNDPLKLDGLGHLQQPAEDRPTAFIVGIDRSRFLQTVCKAPSLREFCDQIFSDSATNSERIAERIFLIAWFPHADRESMRLLRELGFDLVLHDPAILKSTLSKIIVCNTSSNEPFTARSATP